MTEGKRLVQLFEERFKSAEYERMLYVANAKEGTTINDVLEPAYWSHVSQRLRPYDRIEVRIDTGEWLLELVVLAADRNWAQVAVLHNHTLGPADEDMPAARKHEVKFKGPQLKWCVIRVADSEIIFSGLSKAAALAQMASHEHATAT